MIHLDLDLVCTSSFAYEGVCPSVDLEIKPSPSYAAMGDAALEDEIVADLQKLCQSSHYHRVLSEEESYVDVLRAAMAESRASVPGLLGGTSNSNGWPAADGLAISPGAPRAALDTVLDRARRRAAGSATNAVNDDEEEEPATQLVSKSTLRQAVAAVRSREADPSLAHVRIIRFSPPLLSLSLPLAHIALTCTSATWLRTHR